MTESEEQTGQGRAWEEGGRTLRRVMPFPLTRLVKKCNNEAKSVYYMAQGRPEGNNEAMSATPTSPININVKVSNEAHRPAQAHRRQP